MIPADPFSVAFSSFTHWISLAELGDKSQLVCMTLAARHRHWPVILGGICIYYTQYAGSAIWRRCCILGPGKSDSRGGRTSVRGIWRSCAEGQDAAAEDSVAERPGYGIFFTTLTLIFVAEFGDKDTDRSCRPCRKYGVCACMDRSNERALHWFLFWRVGWPYAAATSTDCLAASTRRRNLSAVALLAAWRALSLTNLESQNANCYSAWTITSEQYICIYTHSKTANSHSFSSSE